MVELDLMDFIDVMPLKTSVREIILTNRAVTIVGGYTSSTAIKFKNRTQATAHFSGSKLQRSRRKINGNWKPDKTWRDSIAFTLQPGGVYTYKITGTMKSDYKRKSKVEIKLDDVGGTDPTTGEQYYTGAETHPEFSFEYFGTLLADYWWIFALIIGAIITGLILWAVL